MSFNAVINDKYIILEGTKIDMLAGLGVYINALKKTEFQMNLYKK